jgi:hypothetical protein
VSPICLQQEFAARYGILSNGHCIVYDFHFHGLLLRFTGRSAVPARHSRSDTQVRSPGRWVPSSNYALVRPICLDASEAPHPCPRFSFTASPSTAISHPTTVQSQIAPLLPYPVHPSIGFRIAYNVRVLPYTVAK